MRRYPTQASRREEGHHRREDTQIPYPGKQAGGGTPPKGRYADTLPRQASGRRDTTEGKIRRYPTQASKREEQHGVRRCDRLASPSFPSCPCSSEHRASPRPPVRHQCRARHTPFQSPSTACTGACGDCLALLCRDEQHSTAGALMIKGHTSRLILARTVTASVLPAALVCRQYK
jgi:hypothetical protein